MAEQHGRIEMIKNRLGISGDTQDAVLSDMFGQYLSVAKTVCNRQDEPPALLDIVQDIVAGAYNQRGIEGFSGSNVGGQSYAAINLYDMMRKRLIESGLRILKV